MQRLRVLHPLSAWGGSHVQTCINLLKGMQAAGANTLLDLPRSRVDMGRIPYRSSIPSALSRFGAGRLEPTLVRRTFERFLADLEQDDIAWLWPGVPLEIHREVHRRGIPVIMEGINTRMAWARRVLEPIHAAEGLPPPFDMTDGPPEREEEEMLSMARYFFAPSPGVETAMKAEDSAFRGTILPTSYGAWLHLGEDVDRSGRDHVTVLFMGTVCIRKNAHGLLRAWARLRPAKARLVLCGAIEPHVAKLCRDELNLPSVEARGHVSDTRQAYREADVFVMPSFEEGSPQVTFEAATFGLPLIVSPMGDGGISRDGDTAFAIDPHAVDAMADALERFIRDAELRRDYGARARRAAPRFDWNAVGAARHAALATVAA